VAAAVVFQSYLILLPRLNDFVRSLNGTFGTRGEAVVDGAVDCRFAFFDDFRTEGTSRFLETSETVAVEGVPVVAHKIRFVILAVVVGRALAALLNLIVCFLQDTSPHEIICLNLDYEAVKIMKLSDPSNIPPPNSTLHHLSKRMAFCCFAHSEIQEPLQQFRG
jgi:hypothetical protein